MLRDIDARASSPEEELDIVTISAATAERPSGTNEEAEEWLVANAYPAATPSGHARRYGHSPNSNGLTVPEFVSWFTQFQGRSSTYLGNIPSYFITKTSAGTLSQYASGAIQPGSYGAMNSPLSSLLRDGDLEQELSDVVEEVFGAGLVLDRINAEVRLRVGRVDVEVPPINRPTADYARAVAELPTLDSQGDGFRSFVGLVLLILAERPNVLLIDEPEAFLHPGQARALGRWLSGHAAEGDHQIILATHDRDIVLGLIEGASASAVTFVRLNREGNTTNLTQLSPENVSAVWDQPALRYSNVVQGLFHKRVVMCEGDGDCRFYGAALDVVAGATNRRSIADDVLFLPTGGKGGVPKMAQALTSLGVEARAILDFDVLRNRSDVISIVTALGATWTTAMNDLWVEFSKVPNANQLWETLKKTGLQGLPSGGSYSACVQLLGELAHIGLYVVKVGEMEDYDKSLATHGPAWVSAALTAKSHAKSEVREMVEQVLSDL